MANPKTEQRKDKVVLAHTTNEGQKKCSKNKRLGLYQNTGVNLKETSIA